MWTKMMSGPRKKAPKTIAVIDPDSCFRRVRLFDLSGRLPGRRMHRRGKPDRDGRMVLRRARGSLHRLRPLRDARQPDGRPSSASSAARPTTTPSHDAVGRGPEDPDK